MTKTVHWQNECTSHNFIFLPSLCRKGIIVGGNLMKFWQKRFFGILGHVVCCFNMHTQTLWWKKW